MPTFEEVVRAWLLHYNDRLPNDRTARREAFIVLLGNLLDHGFGKEDLNISKKDKIIKSCVNLNHRNKSKLRKWVSITLNDLEAAILIFYPTIKIRENVVTPEMVFKLESMAQAAEESKKLKTAEDETDSEDYKELDIQDLITGTRQEKQEKILEITDDEFADDEGPEVVYDTEFMKRFGLE